MICRSPTIYRTEKFDQKLPQTQRQKGEQEQGVYLRDVRFECELDGTLLLETGKETSGLDGSTSTGA